jgi:tRNA pseudouridine38-40 synthase
MREAAEFIVGTHDFKCFEASGSDIRENTVRTIYSLEILDGRNHGDLEIHVSGDGFLYNMVRIITGTLVDVGHGKIKPTEIPNIIESKDRTTAGHTAPPYGLYLAEVYY